MNRNEFRYLMDFASSKLTPEERESITARSLEKYSKDVKILVALEEMAELQKEITKVARHHVDNYGLLEEMADVYICLNYIQKMYNIDTSMLNKAIDIKLHEHEKDLTG